MKTIAEDIQRIKELIELALEQSKATATRMTLYEGLLRRAAGRLGEARYGGLAREIREAIQVQKATTS